MKLLFRVAQLLKILRLYDFIVENSKFIRTIRRFRFASSYYNENFRLLFSWSKKNTEDSNFYYDLMPLNLLYLAHFIAAVTSSTPEIALKYFQELDNDVELRSHIRKGFTDSKYGKDIEIKYGRRVGWYAIARIVKPKVVVETGVDHGVGSCLLAAALIKNLEEGSPGEYFGTDINPFAGQLFTGKYENMGKILYGDSIQSLVALEREIDLFINDSDHSGEYEYQEYEAIRSKLSNQAIILGDNAHSSISLAKFSSETSRSFHFFKEYPKDHWYPGAGIGVSINKKL
jgi:hypothetical protein